MFDYHLGDLGFFIRRLDFSADHFEVEVFRTFFTKKILKDSKSVEHFSQQT
eukprot:UN01995